MQETRDAGTRHRSQTGPTGSVGGQEYAGAGTDDEPLFPKDQREGFTDRWHDIQTSFVDQPREAVAEADKSPVADLMQRLEPPASRKNASGLKASGIEATTSRPKTSASRSPATAPSSTGSSPRSPPTPTVRGNIRPRTRRGASQRACWRAGHTPRGSFPTGACEIAYARRLLSFLP